MASRRGAIMDNGAMKGGLLRLEHHQEVSSPRRFAASFSNEGSAAPIGEPFIANLPGPMRHYLKLTASRNGSFAIFTRGPKKQHYEAYAEPFRFRRIGSVLSTPVGILAAIQEVKGRNGDERFRKRMSPLHLLRIHSDNEILLPESGNTLAFTHTTL